MRWVGLSGVIVRAMATLIGTTAVLATVAGCGGSGSGGGGTQPTPTVTVTQTVTAPPPTTTPASSPATSPTASPTHTHPAAAACTTGSLKLSLGQGQGTAGSTYQPIVFTNTSSAPCSLFGRPGVSFVDSSGAQLGKSASNASGVEQTVTLAAGGTASALLQLPDPGVYSAAQCQESTASRLKVYPPNQTGALLVADPVQICTTSAGRASVRPVVAGASGE